MYIYIYPYTLHGILCYYEIPEIHKKNRQVLCSYNTHSSQLSVVKLSLPVVSRLEMVLVVCCHTK
jgi:hypothetical protein